MSNDIEGATDGAQLHLAISDVSRLPKEERYAFQDSRGHGPKKSTYYSFAHPHHFLDGTMQTSCLLKKVLSLFDILSVLQSILLQLQPKCNSRLDLAVKSDG